MSTPKTELPFQFYSIEDVISITKMSRAKIYDMLNPKSPRHDSTFPLPVKIGGNKARTIRWKSDELVAWINNLPRAGYGDI